MVCFSLYSMNSKLKLFGESGESVLGVPGAFSEMLLEGFYHAERRMDGFSVKQLPCYKCRPWISLLMGTFLSYLWSLKKGKKTQADTEN